MENGYYTRQEIFSQPEAWSAALKVIGENLQQISSIGQPSENEGQSLSIQRELKFKNRFSRIIFTGCGSTYYLALAAASLAQELVGVQSSAFPASELWLYPESSYSDGKTLLVAISRSGETTETLNACERFLNEKRGELLTLSCYGDMPLAQMGTLNIILPSGQEQSITQTRAFSTLYISVIASICIWSDRMDFLDSLLFLPEVGTRLLKEYAYMATELGRDALLDRFYWLGSGLRYGLAAELSMKMKEMSLSHSEPFHFLEFRHGPKSMVTKSTLIIGLISTKNRIREQAVLNDLETLGGRILNISETDSAMSFDSGLDESIRNILYLPIGQIIAFERSLSKGLNPDQPYNLGAVVKLK